MSATSQTSSQSLKSLLNRLKLILSQSSIASSAFNDSKDEDDADDDPDKQANIIPQSSQQTDFLSQINSVVKQICTIDSKELSKMLNILSSPLRECISIPGTSKEAITCLQIISDIQPLTYRVPSIDLQLVIAQLCNNDPITRKQAHLFMLATSKKPLNLPTLINAYVTYGFQSQDSLLRQKSVNSYQGLILAQPDAFDSQLNSTYSLLNALLHIWLNDAIQAVQKAADHALVSLCKLDEMRVAVTKLDIDQLDAIKQIAEKHLILGLLPQELENSSIVLQQHKKDKLKNTMTPSNGNNSNNNREIESKLPLKNNDTNTASQNTNSKLQSFGSTSDNPPEEEITKFGMLTDRQLADLSPLNKDWKSKTSAIEDLESKIEKAKDLRSIEKDMRDFLILILSLSSNTNFKIQVTAMNILSSVINLRACIQQANLALLSNSLPEKLGDTKIAVRQIAAKIILQHFQQFREWSWLDELSRQLESRNQQLRGESINVIENILDIAQGSKMTERLNWKLLLTQLAKGVSEQREPFSAKCFRSVGLLKQLLSENESFKEHLRLVLPDIQLLGDRSVNIQGSKTAATTAPGARQIQFQDINSEDPSAAVTALLQKQQILHQPDAYLKNQRYQPTMSEAKNNHTTRFEGDGIFEGTPATTAISSISSRKLSSSTSKPNSFLPSSLLSDNSLPPISMQKKTQDRNIFQQQQQSQQQQQPQVSLQQQQSSILSMLNSKIAAGSSNNNKRDNFSINNTNNRIDTQEDVDSSFGNHNSNNQGDAFSGKNNGYLNNNNNINKGNINVSANSIQLQSTINPRQVNYSAYKYTGQQHQQPEDDLVFDENTSKNIHAEDLFRDQAYGNKQSSAQQSIESSSSSSKALENLKSKRINNQQQQYSKQPQSQARYPSASSAEERYIGAEMQSSASKPPVNNNSKRSIPQSSASASNSANNTPSLPPRKRYQNQGDTSIYEDNSNRNASNSNTNKDSLSELTFSSNQNINIMSPPSPFKKTFKSTGLVTADGGNYTQFEDLERLRNPESAVNGVLSELRSGDWERQFNAMDNIRKLVKFNGEIMVKHSDFGLIMKEVTSLVENLRSSVSKNALVTVSELCEGFKKSMDSFIDSLLGALLKKGMDANVFILQSVRMAFECVSRNCSSGKVSMCCLALLPTAKSANAKQLLTLGLSTILQGDLSKIKDLDRIIISLGGLAQDSSQEVRSAAKNVLIESSQRSSAVLNILNKSYQPAVVQKILTPSQNSNSTGNNQYQSTANSTSNSIFQRSSNSLLQKTNPRGQFGTNTGLSNRMIPANNTNNNTNNSNGNFSRQESQQDDPDDTYLNFRKTPVMISPLSIKLQKNNSQPQQSSGGSSQPSEVAPRTIKSSSLARLQKSNSLNDTLPETLAAADSSDWQTRIGCIGDLEKAAISAPREIINHKSFVRFLDVFVRLNNDSNMKVQTKSLEAFQQLVPLLADSMGNSIQSILNSIFTAASSNNSQIKRKAEETLETIVSSVDSSYLLEPLSNGVLFANPRSKPLILDHLTNICNEVSKKKQQMFQKTITKTIQKLLQENKVELKSSLKKLIQEVYDILEEDMFIGVLASFRDQIMESVQ